MNNPHVDYWSLDIEGAEYPVLKSINWIDTNISLIDVEVNHSGEIFPGSKDEIHEFLKMNGYDYVRSVVIDDIFIFKT